ncbi:YihY/virulence factor BrkB family protein [Puteibacter caeruleilacunae]|nr:YihY/virulence factor BrkB family protein [Puteibacter caeruleilacunae]
MKKIITEKLRRKGLRLAIRARKISLPGFDGVPVYDVALFFWKSIVDGAITTRASAIAFSFFLALFPAIIFALTLIPHIPIDNFQEELLGLLHNMMPTSAFDIIKGTVDDIFAKPRVELLSLGFFMALIFSTNGIASLMSAFDATVHSFHSRNWLAQRGVSLVLVLILSVLVTVSISLMTIGEWVLNYLVEKELLEINITYYLLLISKWLIILAMIFFGISFLYYFAPAKKSKWRFISAGSSLASILTIITSIGFSLYINNFGQYNKLYGSIGAILVVLVWLYFNAIILLIGFELNASIQQAHIDRQEQ